MDINEILQDSLDVEDSKLKRISILAEETKGKQFLVASLEEEVKKIKAEVFELTTVKIPEAFDEAGVSKFVTTSGTTVEVKPYVSGSLPKETVKRFEALNWFRDNGHEGLIKRELSLLFGKGQDEIADALLQKIKSALIEFQVIVEINDSPSIHPQTLQAWAREMMAVPATPEEGNSAIPFDKLGLWVGRQAKIK
jgi:hypothetical protein